LTIEIDQENAEAASLLCCRGLTRRYHKDDIPAVDDLDLAVGPGEFVTLLGSSGSGKSTTLMMVAGFETPDAGSVSLNGRDLTGLPAHKRNLGVVFQSYLLFPHFTVEQNVAFPLKARRFPRNEIKGMVEEALETVRLPEYAKRMPKQLSGGQQQRVAVARAICAKPSLLLMDEPLGALDERLRKDLQSEIRRIHRELGTAVLYVTHDQVEAMSMSDRIVLMRSGKVEQAGSPEELFDRPATPYAARFMGDAAFMSGKVTQVRSSGQYLLEVPAVAGAVRASGPVGWEVGQAAEVVLRSRAVRLSSAADQGRPTFQVRVEDVSYVGDGLRVAGFEVRTGGRFQAVFAPQGAPETGVLVDVALDDSNLWCVRDEATH
jgi:putative spermidine/putrescine transport system ATP-binding protein